MASLMSPSPSITTTTRRGTPSRPAIDVAASGSVGATTAPRMNASCQERPATTSCATSATPPIVANTSPIGEHADRCRVRTELAQRGVEGGRVEQRRQERDEDEIRRQLDVRHPREQADDEPADDEQDRIRHAQDGTSTSSAPAAASRTNSCSSSCARLDGATLADGGASRLGAA